MKELICMPKFWYIARIKYLNEQLQSMPDARIGSHRGKIVVRVGTTPKYRQIGPKSEKFDSYFGAAKEREKITKELAELRSEFEEFFGEKIDDKMLEETFCFKSNSSLNMEFWNGLVDDECDWPYKSQFPLDGHIFRSKIEREVAQAARELHLVYKYDSGIDLGNSYVYADFVFAFPEFDRCEILEVFGLMGDTGYALKNASKLSNYAISGILLNRDLFAFACNEKYSPDDKTIKRQLVYMVQTLCDSIVSSHS